MPYRDREKIHLACGLLISPRLTALGTLHHTLSNPASHCLKKLLLCHRQQNLRQDLHHPALRCGVHWSEADGTSRCVGTTQPAARCCGVITRSPMHVTIAYMGCVCDHYVNSFVFKAILKEMWQEGGEDVFVGPVKYMLFNSAVKYLVEMEHLENVLSSVLWKWNNSYNALMKYNLQNKSSNSV